MKSNGIQSGSIMLFQTAGQKWRVIDAEGDGLGDECDIPETYYWNDSLRDAMRCFGFLTARKDRFTNNQK